MNDTKQITAPDDGRRKTALLTAAMLAAAGLSAVLRPQPQADPARTTMRLEDLFPRTAGDWRTDAVGEAFVLPADERGQTLRIYDQVLERTYVNPAGQRIMLSVAYGSEQSVGLQMHRPEVCYESGGYTVSDEQPARLDLAGRSLPARRLVARNASRIEPITYWMLLGDAPAEDAYRFRLRQLAFGLRGRILDGMLVRISSVDPDEQRAWAMQATFATRLIEAMDPQARARVLGRTQ